MTKIFKIWANTKFESRIYLPPKPNDLFNGQKNDWYFWEISQLFLFYICTTDNLLKLTQHVTEAFQWSEMVGFVCIDDDKAFDEEWRLGLQNKLQKMVSINLW